MKISVALRSRAASFGVAVAVVSSTLVLLGAAPAQAVVPPCGSTITTDTVLTGDMFCPQQGIIINGNGVTLDLNGHTISGAGPNTVPNPPFGVTAGVRVNGGNRVTVKNGRIQGFNAGVTTTSHARGSTAVGLTLVNNRNGILFQTTAQDGSAGFHHALSNTIQQSNVGISDNAFFTWTSGNTITAGNFGIVVRGNRTVLESNRLDGHTGIGVQINAHDTITRGNSVSNGRSNGISVRSATGSPGNPAMNNRVENNTLSGNGNADQTLAGISVSFASSTVVPGNRVSGIGRGPGIAVSESTGTKVQSNQTASNFDGILVTNTASSTVVQGNIAVSNIDDGIDVDSASTTITANTANGNGDRGIEATAGVTDGGGNGAAGNGNPQQCSFVVCT